MKKIALVCLSLLSMSTVYAQVSDVYEIGMYGETQILNVYMQLICNGQVFLEAGSDKAMYVNYGYANQELGGAETTHCQLILSGPDQEQKITKVEGGTVDVNLDRRQLKVSYSN